MIRRRERRPDRHRREELRDLRAGEHRLHSVDRLGGTGVDRGNPGMREVAALEREMLHTDERDVVDVSATALNQPRILAPLDPLADEFGQYRSRRHGLPLLPSRALNRVDDVLVTGAAAEIPGDALADFLFRWLRRLLEQ